MSSADVPYQKHSEKSLLADMCENIIKNKAAGVYDGAYKVVELAMAGKGKQA